MHIINLDSKPLQLWLTCIVVLCALFANYVRAADWSNTELHYQSGDLDNAFSTGSTDTEILTLQHASGWKYGDNFFFVDLKETETNNDAYAELYLNFSLGKITGKTVGAGPLKDIGVVYGLNVAADANTKKHLPGIRLDWDVPGFVFFKTMFTAYIDDSQGTPVPAQDDSYMIDVAWLYPFGTDKHRFSITGHAEYIDGRKNDLGNNIDSWILAQPQFRYDLGHSLFNVKDQLYVGVEYQYWQNKLGDPNTDESAIQALVVWRL